MQWLALGNALALWEVPAVHAADGTAWAVLAQGETVYARRFE